MTDKIQHRATCAACFGVYAVKGSLLVHHGYQRPGHGWQTPSCYGAYKAHFGTPEGLKIAEKWLVVVRQMNERHVAKVAELEPAFLALPPYRAWPKDSAERKLTDDYYEHSRLARWTASEIKDLEKRIADWVPAAPVEVKVAAKVVIIHLADPHRGGKVCAGLMADRWSGQTTNDRKAVTCTRCAARFAWLDKREAAKAAQATR
jgi:hypothetical protein